MSLSDPSYLGFFAVVFVLFYLLPGGAARLVLVLAASLAFYVNIAGPFVAVLLLIAQGHVEARLALLHLGDGVGADRGLQRVLHVGDADAVTRGGSVGRSGSRIGVGCALPAPSGRSPLPSVGLRDAVSGKRASRTLATKHSTASATRT